MIGFSLSNNRLLLYVTELGAMPLIIAHSGSAVAFW
jgi:hypothetical protein